MSCIQVGVAVFQYNRIGLHSDTLGFSRLGPADTQPNLKSARVIQLLTKSVVQPRQLYMYDVIRCFHDSRYIQVYYW